MPFLVLTLPPIVDRMQLFRALDLVFVPVFACRNVLADRLLAAELALLLDVDLVLGLRASKEGAGKRVEIGHGRFPREAR